MSNSKSKDLIIRAAQQLENSGKLVAEMKKELEAKSENADFGEAVRKNDEWWEVREVAKQLNIEVRPGKSIGTNQLYNFLMNSGLAMYPKDFVSGKHYYAPQQPQEDSGRMKIGETETNQENNQGERIFDHRLLIGTEKGVPYIMKKLLEAKEDGILEDLCLSWRSKQGWR